MKKILIASLIAGAASVASANHFNSTTSYDLSRGALGYGYTFNLHRIYDADGNNGYVTYSTDRHYRFNDGQKITNNGTGIADFNPLTTTTSAEYGALEISGLEDAHNEGWTGNGVQITVQEVDPEIGSHAAHVSGIAQAVAPSSNIRVVDEVNFTSNFSAADQVVNRSYGSIVTSDIYDFTAPTWARILDHETGLAPNAIHINSAGNYGHYNIPTAESYGGRLSLDTSTFARYHYLGGADMSRTIYVGSVTEDDELEWYSNSAGTSAMHDFIVASGHSLTENRNGTSFAAPRVAGAAALVIHKFNTSPVNTKQILLESADDLGAPGVDPVFGHGKLNISAALSPIGHLN